MNLQIDYKNLEGCHCWRLFKFVFKRKTEGFKKSEKYFLNGNICIFFNVFIYLFFTEFVNTFHQGQREQEVHTLLWHF